MPAKQDAFAKILEGEKGFKFTLRARDPLDKNVKRFQYLKDRGWIDEQALSLEAKVVAYNYQLDIPRLLKVQFNFYFSRGGGIYTTQKIEVATLKTWPRHNRALLLFVDCVFFLMCLASSAFMAREFQKDLKAGKCFGHFNIINTITWLSCLFGTSAFPSPLYSARAGSPGSPPGAFLQSCFTDPESGVQEGMPLRVLTMSFRWREHEGTKGLTIPVYTHTFLLDLESMEEEGVVRASSFLTSNGRCAVYDRFFIVCSFS
ncbi:unnamed protein product [Durusdinium trenchii]|uniref:Uncharacterized protein n=1 Tax=Durusdinium trenchii TaxID=1381693 RepID=A0ABP0HP89_9DINO